MAGAETYPRFAEAIGVGDAALDLTQAALAIAEVEYPDLDPERYHELLGELAAGAAAFVDGDSALERVLRFNEFLYGREGFCGNRSDYYDPRNSYLHQVLERRTGIPITLALVYMDVATRLGLDVRGVGFPGHFLVKHLGAPEVVVDPFSGDVLSQLGCEQLYRAALGDDATFDPRALHATPPRQILGRVLGNLKQIHMARREFDRALTAIDRLLLLHPDDPAELRDRGLIYAKLECFRAALDDLERFVELAPRDPTAAAVRRQLALLGDRARMLN